MIDTNISLFLTSACLTLVLFSIHSSLLRAKQQTYLALALFFTCIGILISKRFVSELSPSLNLYMLALSLPALLTIAPSFWCYVEGLTHTQQWAFKRKHAKHFILSFIGLFIAVATMLLPDTVTHAVLSSGDEVVLDGSHIVLRYFVYGLLTTTFILILGWVIQSGYYMYSVIAKLASYRGQLKQAFSSTESKEFYWLTWLIVAIGSTWLLLASYIVLDNLFYSIQIKTNWYEAFALFMIWTVSIWTLRYKPGFEEIYDLKSGEKLIADDYLSSKYQRSALNRSEAENIAKKVELVMFEQKAYLDPNLSLPKLAKLANTIPNYLSQTLNETLSISFFDYVNKYRIEAAKERLLTTKDAVIDIATEVGFNSKSSFYSAFKKEGGTTPSKYRSIGKD